MLGINLRTIFTITFGLGTALAGFAGVLAAPLWSVVPSMADMAIMPAFVVVTIGGLGSFRGTVIAGLLVGVSVALTIQFFPGGLVGRYVHPDGLYPAGPAARAVWRDDGSASNEPLRRIVTHPIFILSVVFALLPFVLPRIGSTSAWERRSFSTRSMASGTTCC